MEKLLIYISITLFCFLFSNCEVREIAKPLKTYKIKDGLIVNLGENYIIDATDSEASGYYWDDENAPFGKNITTISEYKFRDTGNFRVVVYFANDSSIYNIKCNPEILIYIPTIFSTNTIGPEENDVFRIEADGFEDFQLMIYDLDNTLMYYSSDYPTHGWDGNTLKNNPAPQGKYMYYVTLTNLGSGEHNYSGLVSLIR
ncbi:MAG: hypothetical protein HOD63_04400 [Bacteroidetes bacterium]|jgi:hypothetical protein|nr:hypothetical protein [Bacteroidota bacterium]MBT5528944.1 hypothetical protein [Cytophagia bacterium]MBT3422665.1 hypothetical protein [Bacteroidota bacterium]MBT3800559.1 hypothetical protein [Bacteroidota bacterium]MBT3935022.1 hypothetical protein [Bacteroidota bacterium]